MIDIHSHIIPGVDDGARTLADGIDILRELAEGGVTDVIATPHYIDETIYASPKATNRALLIELGHRLAEEGIEIRLHLGNEIYINDRINELVNVGVVSPLAGSRYLLVELPMSGEFPNYEDILADLTMEGYRVILAHPERYLSIQDNYDIVHELDEMGVLLQCNLGSIVGKYGKSARKVVKKLAKEKMIFTFGSDIHHHHSGWEMNEVKEKLSKYYSDAELEEVLTGNARKILENVL